MDEAFNYASMLNTWTDDDCFIPYTSGILPINPIKTDLIPFEEDLLTLNGCVGYAEIPVVLTGRFVIAGELFFGPVGFGEKFEFYEKSEIYLVAPEAKLTILEESQVDLAKYMTIAGSSFANYITIIGELSTSGVGIEFKGIDGGQWKGLVYDDVSQSHYNAIDDASFTDCLITGNTMWLSLSDNSFINSAIILSASNISIILCTFTNSYTNFTYNFSGFDYITIYHTNFYGQGSINTAVSINGFPNFNIHASNIYNHNAGIKIYNSGNGASNSQFIYNQIYYCTGPGISIYNSKADIDMNHCSYNNYGIKLYDRSNISIIGNEKAEYIGETQTITDNSSYELYASHASFPHTIRWNAIRDEDNSEPMVYNSGEEGPFDVRNNYWGVNFNPEEDFYPWLAYIYDPVWEIPMSNNDEDEIEVLFTSGLEQKADSNYAQAKTVFEELISTYPESKYAQASLKELVDIEKYAENDYVSLKSYLNSDPNIQNNPELVKLADFLANRCNLKLENWPNAISWFEDVIQNPESVEDSIFAIIDLGYTYWLMENGGMKSSNYVGAMPQYKFATVQAFEENRDYLLSLLPGEETKLSETTKNNISALKDGELLQNIPNPFAGVTTIYYKLEHEATVTVNIFNYTGKLIKTYNDGLKTGGVHNIVFDGSYLPSGMYFYTININGVKSDSKKMVIK